MINYKLFEKAGFIYMKDKKKYYEMIFCIIILAISIFALAYIRSRTTTLVSDAYTLNFKTIPTLWIVLLITFSAINVIKNIISFNDKKILTKKSILRESIDKEPHSKKNIVIEKTHLIKALLTLICLFGFAYLVRKINFFIITTLFSFILFRVYNQKNYYKNFFVSLAGGGLLYLIIVKFLKIPI